MIVDNVFKVISQTPSSEAVIALVRKHLEQTGARQRDFAKHAGFSFFAFNKFMNHRRKKPFTLLELDGLATAMGITRDELIGAAMQVSVNRPTLPDQIPVINYTAAGGVHDYHADQCVESEVHDAMMYVPRDGITRPGAFGVIVCGRSMADLIQPDDLIIFDSVDSSKPDRRLEPGVIVWARFGNDSNEPGATIAYWFPQPDGKIQLRKHNKDFETIVEDRANIVGLGVFIQLRRGAIR